MAVAICSPSLAPGQTQVAVSRHLGVIIGEPDGREGAGGEHGNPDEAVAEVGPE